MYRLSWEITIGKYKVKTVKDVKITASVLNLSDTASITLPGKYLNTWKSVENKIKVGDEVVIKLGYDDDNETEFNGYLKRISRDNNSIVLECEDALYLLNKSVANREYKDISLRDLLSDILKQVDSSLQTDCDYDYTMKKLVVFHQTALDVLKKVHDDTKANIWFEDKTLHIHPVYDMMGGISSSIIYDTKTNVQSNELKWVDKTDKKVKIEIAYNMPDGNLKKQSFGDDNGETITRYSATSDDSELKKIAENEYNLWNYSGYEGCFTGWLIPRTKAGESIRLRDKERNEDGTYYVTGVEIEFGQNGAKRKVTLGRKLG